MIVNFLLLFFLLLLLTILPLVNFSFFAFSFEFSKFSVFLFFAGILTFLIGWYLLKQKTLILPAKKISLGLLLFFIIYLVSVVFSVNPLTSFLGYFGFFTGGLIYTFLLLIIFYLAFLLNREKVLILQTMFFSGTLVAISGLWQYLTHFQRNSEFIYRIHATIGQPNRLAFFLMALLPIGFFLLLWEKRVFTKGIYGIFLILNFLTFLLTFSRSSFVILSITFLLIIWYLSRIKKTIPKSVLISFFLGITVFGLIFAQSAISTFKNYSNSSLSLRLAEWQGSTKAILNRNVLRQFIGFGPETAYFVFFKYRPATYNQSQEETAVGPGQIRNHYLNLLSGIGLLGLAAYLFLTLHILKIAYKNSSKDFLDSGVFFSLVAIMLMSFFYYQTDAVLVIFWVLAGLVIGGTTSIDIGWETKILKKIAGIFLMGGGLVLFYSVIRLSLAHYYASAIATEINFQKAVNLNPLFDVYRRNLSKFYMYEMLSMKDSNKELALRNFTKSQTSINEARVLSPIDIRNIRQLLLIKYYGGIYFDKKYQYENVEVARKLTDLSPTDPLSWDLLGLVYLDIGQLPEAKTAFEREKDLVPNFPGVYLHLGEVAKQQGKIQEAIRLYEKALQFSPGLEMAKQELEKAQKLILQK